MNQSSFWRDRRVLVLGCTGFLGAWVVRKLIEQGASVVGLVHESQRPSELFRTHLDAAIQTVRGTADAGRIRSLLAIQQPSAVFQLAASADNPHLKTVITADLLRAMAEQSSDAVLLTPVAPTERQPHYQNRSRLMRVGFVTLPTLFGPGDARGRSWTSRLFQAAADRRNLPRPGQDDAGISHVADAADSLLAAAEVLSSLPDAPANGLRLEPPATTTARELFETVERPVSLVGDRLGEAVRETLAWYQSQQLARGTEVSTRAAA